jgi:hypothetical protein
LLETLAQAGELVGGLGALAALGYLAIQIRQSNTLAKAHSRQTLLDNFSQLNWEMARDPELARVISLGLQKWPVLSETDKTSFDLAMGRYLSNLHNGLLLMDAGMLDKETFDVIANYMLICIPTPGGSNWWRDTAMAAPVVREYIDLRTKDASGLPGNFKDVVPHWYALADSAHTDEQL